MDIIEIRRMLAEGFCNLQYVKKDGTTRAATGTTCLELIPAFHRPKGVRPNEREGLVNYFDYAKLDMPLHQAYVEAATQLYFDQEKEKGGEV